MRLFLKNFKIYLLNPLSLISTAHMHMGRGVGPSARAWITYCQPTPLPSHNCQLLLSQGALLPLPHWREYNQDILHIHG